MESCVFRIVFLPMSLQYTIMFNYSYNIHTFIFGILVRKRKCDLGEGDRNNRPW
jgi:hypothetical protein